MRATATSNEFLFSLYQLDNNNGINYGLRWLNEKMLPVDPNSSYGASSDGSLGNAGMGTLGPVHRFADRSEPKTTWNCGRRRPLWRCGTARR